MCAPKLYHTVVVRSVAIADIVGGLANPHSVMAKYTEELEICGQVPWQSLARLLRALPSVRTLRIMIGSGSAELFEFGPIIEFPALIQLGCIATSCIVAENLTLLLLERQYFASSADILRLFTALPRLSRTQLKGCAILNEAVTVPFMENTELRVIRAEYRRITLDAVAEAAFLARWWQWPCTTLGDTPYPGLHPEDAQYVVRVIRCIDPDIPKFRWPDRPRKTKVLPDRPKARNAISLTTLKGWYPESCKGRFSTEFRLQGDYDRLICLAGVLVATFEATLASDVCKLIDMEFHVTTDSCVPSQGARVRHIILRVSPWSPSWRPHIPNERTPARRKIILNMFQHTLLFRSLVTVTLETPRRSEGDALMRHMRRSNIDALRRLRVHRRTCQSAQRIAHDVMQGTYYRKSHAVISPLWYSSEYSDEDRQQWYVSSSGQSILRIASRRSARLHCRLHDSDELSGPTSDDLVESLAGYESGSTMRSFATLSDWSSDPEDQDVWSDA